jgi:peptidoglycan/xylan/chitin deacetylase (PgdA/CDA1 family)
MEFVEKYSEIKNNKHGGLRGKIRSLALDALFVSDRLKGHLDFLDKPRIQFLYIHHAFKDEERRLEALLKQLSLNHTFIPYTDAINKILNRQIDKPYICISSDDGFKNNIRVAEILNQFDVKGCFFINPFIVGNKSFEVIKAYCKGRLNFPPVDFMNWDDIEFLQSKGHEIGSHTMSHINVPLVSHDFFLEDCRETYDTLIQHCGEANHFAFPYGRFSNFNNSSRIAVFSTGFKSCASAERGCHVNHERILFNEELCILRDHVILDWDISHILHFLINNSRQATTANNLFPYLRIDS